ncbi:MAG: thioredoxin domain-containing protein [Candidatus Micrarchaeota archaeon]
MVLCIVALVVFGILGIFSAKHRVLAKEAFQCVFRMVTLRPCESSFDERLKAQILSKTISFSPSLARGVNRHFQLLSWFFTILFFASLAYSALGVYNYWAYGNCNGPDSTGFCALDALLRPGADHSFGKIQPGIGPALGSGNVTLIEFGCFSCPFTKQAEKPLKQFLSQNPNVKLEFRAFPIPSHAFSREAAEAAFCAQDQGKFWEYHDLLFERQAQLNPNNLKAWAGELGLNQTQFNACVDSRKYASKVDADFEEGKKLGVYGTPTFFFPLTESVLVGPKQPWELEKALKEKVIDRGENGVCPPPIE